MARRDIAGARKRWELFHQKKIRKEIDVNAKWPTKWVLVGSAETTYYGSDKWHENGDIQRYFHDHGKSVKCFEPAGTTKGVRAKTVSSPLKHYPDSAAVLGYFLGADIRVGDQLYRSTPKKGTLLCSSPNGDALFAWDGRRIVALFAGSGLSVLAAGICG